MRRALGGETLRNPCAPFEEFAVAGLFSSCDCPIPGARPDADHGLVRRDWFAWRWCLFPFTDIIGYSKRLTNEQHALIDGLNRIVRGSDEFQRAEGADWLTERWEPAIQMAV